MRSVLFALAFVPSQVIADNADICARLKTEIDNWNAQSQQTLDAFKASALAATLLAPQGNSQRIIAEMRVAQNTASAMMLRDGQFYVFLKTELECRF